MKKALLALAALLLTATTTNAQIQKWQGENMWAKAPKTTLLTPNKAKKIQKADLADNQRIMGFYTGDELGSNFQGWCYVYPGPDRQFCRWTDR